MYIYCIYCVNAWCFNSYQIPHFTGNPRGDYWGHHVSELFVSVFDSSDLK